MKFVIRAFAMFVVFVGLTAASVSPATPTILVNQISASAAGPGPMTLPVPVCQPLPCTPGPGAFSR